MLPINEIINSYYIDNEETLLRVLKQIKNIKKGNIKYPCVLIHFESIDDEPMWGDGISEEYTIIYPKR